MQKVCRRYYIYLQKLVMKERSVDRKSERCGCGKVFEESCFSREQPPEEKRKKTLSVIFTHIILIIVLLRSLLEKEEKTPLKFLVISFFSFFPGYVPRGIFFALA
jgi:hypothetical protein